MAIVALLVSLATAISGDTTADSVLGQPDFLHSGLNDGAGLEPIDVSIDDTASRNRLYVANIGNSWILDWHNVSAFTNGAPPDLLMIGQPDCLSTGCNNGGASKVAPIFPNSGLCNPEGIAAERWAKAARVVSGVGT